MSLPANGAWSLPRELLAPSRARDLLVAFEHERRPEEDLVDPDSLRERMYAPLLLVTELVTNAIRHGAGAVTMRAETTLETLRVSVHDAGAATPFMCHPHPMAESGRGLVLVDALSSTWGVTPHDEDGKTVWFEVARPF